MIVVPKNIRLNSGHHFIMKVPNKQELQQITFNHSSDSDFMNVYKKFITKPYFSLVTDFTLASDNPLSLTKSLLERI